MTARRPGWARADLLICLALFYVTVAVYYPVRNFDFVNYDDPAYVSQNPHLRDGLSPRGIGWAVTSGDAANWFPVTRLSHLLDYQLFGLNSGFHHLVNVVLHALASVALLVFLLRATGTRWQSAFVAFVFALHPLHVESVAWVAERKDVLCALFWFLTLGAWVRYTESPGRGRYLAALGLFALGLMSKPMMVTLPFALLLVDGWPLGRPFAKRLLLEKVPFFALAAAGAVATYMVQRSGAAVQSLDKYPTGLRIENALIAWVVYIAKAFWPTGLAVFYPYPGQIPLWQAGAAALALAAISGMVLWVRRSQPYLACGWFWYLGTLVPVIGLVQVGAQARADRYTYIPVVGLSIMLAWSGARLLGRWPRPAAVAAVAACVALAVACRVQLGYWRGSEPLFERALAVTSGNYVAYMDLGTALMGMPGRLPDAMSDFEAALRIKPDYAVAHVNLGNCLFTTGHLEEAISNYRGALQIDPDYAIAHNDLGYALQRAGRLSEATAEYREALRIDPASALAHSNMGFALAAAGRTAEAISEYQAALTIDPDSGLAHSRMGDVLLTTGRTDDAMAQYDAALLLDPNSAEAHNGLGSALMRSPGRLFEAVPHLEAAVRIDRSNVEAQVNLGNALLRLSGRKAEGIAHLEAAYRLRPDPALREELDQLEAAQPSR